MCRGGALVGSGVDEKTDRAANIGEILKISLRAARPARARGQIPSTRAAVRRCSISSLRAQCARTGGLGLWHECAAFTDQQKRWLEGSPAALPARKAATPGRCRARLQRSRIGTDDQNTRSRIGVAAGGSWLRRRRPSASPSARSRDEVVERAEKDEVPKG